MSDPNTVCLRWSVDPHIRRENAVEMNVINRPVAELRRKQGFLFGRVTEVKNVFVMFFLVRGRNHLENPRGLSYLPASVSSLFAVVAAFWSGN